MSSRRSRRGVDAKGRSTGFNHPVLILRRSLVHSPQFSALSSTARSLLLELQGIYNGTNNGRLFLSVRDAAARLGLADLKAAMNAFNELETLGFISQTVAAH